MSTTYPKDSIDIGKEDAALIFKKNGMVKASFPHVDNFKDEVPPHILLALTLSSAITDEQFVQKLQKNFSSSLLGGDSNTTEKQKTITRRTSNGASLHLLYNNCN